jgi:hypothetical protein
MPKDGGALKGCLIALAIGVVLLLGLAGLLMSICGGGLRLWHLPLTWENLLPYALILLVVALFIALCVTIVRGRSNKSGDSE